MESHELGGSASATIWLGAKRKSGHCSCFFMAASAFLGQVTREEIPHLILQKHRQCVVVSRDPTRVSLAQLILRDRGRNYA